MTLVQESVGLTGVIKWKDVRMLQLRRDLDFAEETFGPNRYRQFGTQHIAANDTSPDRWR